MLPDSSKPYLIRAIYEWCIDEGYTPHVVVRVDQNCQVPQAYVRDHHITLNIGALATKSLMIDNQWVSFSARFNGQAQELMFPVATVVAIYARETEEGMSFLYHEKYTLDESSRGEMLASSQDSEGSKKASVLRLVKDE